ncbi:MAG: hypothetical protein R3B13_23620 [Polyangiaceae bacterium]
MRLKIASGWFGLACGLWLCAGCGSDDAKGSPAGDAGVDAAPSACSSEPHVDACTQLASAYCTKLFDCDANLAITSQWDSQLCQAVQKSKCVQLTEQFEVGADMPANAAQRVSAMDCGDFLNDVGEFLPFGGIGGDGEACNFKSVCLGDNKVCSTQVQGETGVCQTPTSVPCQLVDLKYECPQGLICNVPSKQCVVVSTGGTKPKAPGAACSPGEACAGTHVCTAGTCTPGDPVEKQPNAGAPCGGDQNFICGLGLVCVGGDDGSVTGTCAPAGESGQACPSNLNPKVSNPLCVGGLECVAGVCDLPGCK